MATGAVETAGGRVEQVVHGLLRPLQRCRMSAVASMILRSACRLEPYSGRYIGAEL
jgi:hypothetical protein